MAATWLKLDVLHSHTPNRITIRRYDLSEHCAQHALVLDPTFMKARCRGLARRGNLQPYVAILGALTLPTCRVTTPCRAAEIKC